MRERRYPDRRTWAEKMEADQRAGVVELRERYKAARLANARFGDAMRREHSERVTDAEVAAE